MQCDADPDLVVSGVCDIYKLHLVPPFGSVGLRVSGFYDRIRDC